MVEGIDIGPLLVKYKEGGTSSYHPRMMLKVLVYACTEKICSSRRIAKGLRENVNMMWLSGGNKPDFRTINRFHGETMKEDRAAEKPLPPPAYNVRIGTEGQFIVGYSIHQRAGDPGCFIPHMEQPKLPQGTKIQNLSGDAAYGSEENYAYLEEQQIGNYLKYNTFYRETHPPRKPELIQKASFRVENLPYNPDKDEFTCPANHPLTYRETRPYRTENGYLTQRRFYECSACATCPLKP